MTGRKKIRVLLARLGMDSHWRGSVVVARALRDAGMEVIYLGNENSEAIVKTAIQEDVDVVGLSTLSGNHMVLAPEVLNRLKAASADDILVILGGTVPHDHIPQLKDMGLDEFFGPGSSLKYIVDYVRKNAGKDAHGH